ncbi:MAG: FliH/SctL family protein [Pseudomonadota bacterium]
MDIKKFEFLDLSSNSAKKQSVDDSEDNNLISNQPEKSNDYDANMHDANSHDAAETANTDNINQENIAAEDIALSDNNNDNSNALENGISHSSDDVNNSQAVNSEKLFTQEELDNLVKEAYQNGYDNALEDNQEKMAEQQKILQENDVKLFNDLLAKISLDFATFTKEYWDNFKILENNCINLSYDIMVTLTDEIIAKDNLPVIKNAIAHALKYINDTPQITIKINPQYVKKLEENLDNILAGAAFWGEIKVQSDNNLSNIDIKLEWNKAQIICSYDNIKANIKDIIDEATAVTITTEDSANDEKISATNDAEPAREEPAKEDGQDESVNDTYNTNNEDMTAHSEDISANNEVILAHSESNKDL